VEDDDRELVEESVQAGADVNAKDAAGCTALHVAAKNKSAAAAAALPGRARAQAPAAAPLPAELFFEVAQRRRVAVIARVPLASGLISGRFTRDTEFPAADHRAFNRDGAGFDRGETFSGVDYEVGLAAVERLRPLVPPGATLAQFALKWILSFEAVSCVIPGARRPSQVEDNARAANLPSLSAETLAAVQEIYDDRVRPLVHHRW
jgi:aryl-alcohol dehydrogenase-like predicted oxidoreductase